MTLVREKDQGLQWKAVEPPVELSWIEARKSFSLAAPQVTEIIDKIAPDNSFKLIRMRYPYGACLYEAGQFFVSTGNGKILPLSDPAVPAFVKNNLSYKPVPLGCLTHGSFEVFKEFEDHISPIAYRNKGLVLGVWEAFMPPSPFTVTAGSRSIFMLPKLSNSIGHSKLKKYGIGDTIPMEPSDHWNVFKSIINHENFSEEWYTEIIFFTKKWNDAIFNNPKWSELQRILLLKHLKHTEPYHLRVTYDSILDNFSLIRRSKKSLKKSPHIIEAFKYILAIANGILPGFKVLTEDQSPCPSKELINIYLNEYGLKTYIPTMMYADYFNKANNEFIYYPMRSPMSLNALSITKAPVSIRSDLLELIELTDDFIRELQKGNLGAGTEIVLNLFHEVEFNFFHNQEDINLGLYPSSDMPSEDPNLLYVPSQNKISAEFCMAASAVNGCVRISKK
jgi:hypothetical protein